jgi:hypothetical protein
VRVIVSSFDWHGAELWSESRQSAHATARQTHVPSRDILVFASNVICRISAGGDNAHNWGIDGNTGFNDLPF